MPAGPHHVLLVPGFFGFTSFGDFAYWEHVRALLSAWGPAAGIDGEAVVVRTVPTASLPRRAAALAAAAHEVLERRGGTLSLVGHSSGGLDARLLVSPGTALPTGLDVEAIASRVRAVVTVATPHLGTPVAHHFNNLLGQQVLKALSIATIYAVQAGHLPLSVALQLARLVAGGRASRNAAAALLDGLLQEFELDRRLALREFLGSLEADQDLLPQITPAAMDLFDAATGDRPGVRYGCVVTRASPPGLRSLLHSGPSPYAQATHALYVALHRLARGEPRLAAAVAGDPRIAALDAAFGAPTSPAANDGMVPTLSQLHGQLVAAVWADHLDVLGHFDDPEHAPPHHDWLTSGTGFTRKVFEALWRAVVAFLAVPALQAEAPGAQQEPAGL